MTEPVRKLDGSACGKKSAATLKPYAVPTPRLIRVNMFRWRVRSEFQPRTKNGRPAQRATGVVKRNWIHWLRRVAIQKRRVISLASEFSSFGSPVTATGSRAIPQIGQ